MLEVGTLSFGQIGLIKQVETHREVEQRGSHVSIRHVNGHHINLRLIEDVNVIPDFREPNNIRLGLTPIYTSFQDVWENVNRIQRVVTGKRPCVPLKLVKPLLKSIFHWI